MAAIKISDLPENTSPTLNDIIPSVNSGETKKLSLDNLKTLIGSGGGSAGTSNYEELENKPKINNVELVGNKTLNELGINIPDTSNFITKDVTNLTNYYDKTYINNTIGNIETTLQNINSGSGV